MANYNSEEQAKKLAEIRAREEEDFVQQQAERFGVPYIDLTSVNIETDALLLLEESVSRSAKMACFRMKGSDLYIAVQSPQFGPTVDQLDILSRSYLSLIHI